MNKKVIIFDLDGVLIDSGAIVFKHLLESFPKITSAVHKEILAGNFHEEMERFKIENGYVGQETEEVKAARRLAYAKKKLEAPMYSGAKNLLEELHNSGFCLVLNTSAYDRNTLPLLERFGITSLFDLLATAELSKSKVEKFKIIEKKYNLLRESLLFVTDTLGDLREADQAGVPTIAVTWGAHDRSFFNREPHSNLLKVVDSMDELKSFIYAYAQQT